MSTDLCRWAIRMTIGLALCAAATDAHGALMACGAKDRVTGLLRDGATIRVRTVCRATEVVVDLTQLTTTPPAECAADAVPSGGRCVDKYEASAWDIPPLATDVIAKVKAGTVTLADLTAAGAVQVGYTGAPFFHAAIPPTFPIDGNFAAPIYAVSIPGVLPTTSFAGYQAHFACRLSGKRLLTPGEWLDAMTDTPDPDTDDGASDCNTGSPGTPTNAPSETGSRSSCVSVDGAFDGLGNVLELTRDPDSPFGGAQAWTYGGLWWEGASASVETGSILGPNVDHLGVGFRCAR
ncbi:MAG: hypothetical protein FJ148_25285 [Deltaproteobacteria bacterium]|nr:hypothetical protein [Deltaproteobacteria bacterium]